MLLLLALCLTLTLAANEEHPCVKDYEPQPGDDEKVEITVGQMRIANCAYELVPIIIEERDSYKELFDESNKALSDCSEEAGHYQRLFRIALGACFAISAISIASHLIF